VCTLRLVNPGPGDVGTQQTRRVNAFGGERGRFGADRGVVGEHNQKGCGGQAGGAEMGARWAEVGRRWREAAA
jgi:hypothetical protein